MAREGIDFADRRQRIVDGFEQIFALSLEKRMALCGFSIFLKRHHVYRAHHVELCAQLAVCLIFRGQLFAAQN